MKKKWYEENWFIILMIFIFFPVGLFLMWRYANWNIILKIIISVVFGFLIFLSMFSEPVKTYSSKISYETEGIPAKEEVTETLENLKTEINGNYIIGEAPKDYVSGEEEEFTTAQSGNYVAGEDFPVGVYDIVPVSGGGNVQGSDLNVIMGVEGGDFYTDYYDNKEFKDGNTLKVSGVSVKLIPQTKDDFYIPEGTYNLEAIEGGGNVQGSGLNEIMGVEGGSLYVKSYDNASLKKGANLKLSGVALELEPKEKEVVVQEATEAVPGEEITEEYEITDQEGAKPTCKSNDKEVSCKDLEKYDELKKDIDRQMKE